MITEQKVTHHSAASATATGTPMNTGQTGSVLVQITGTFVATVTFQGTVDGSNWVALQAVNMTSGAIATTATAAGLYLVPVPGMRLFRCDLAWASGTSITVTGEGTSLGAAGASTLAEQGPDNPTIDSYSSAVVNLAASTADQELVAAPGASKQIWVYGLFMMADTAAGTVTLQDEDDTALSGTMAVSDEGGWVLPMSGNFAMPWAKVSANKALEADTGACTVDGILCYAIVSI